MNEEDLKATKIQVQVLEEILRYKDKEIEKLKEMKLHTEKYASEMEDKYILEKNKNDKAIEYINKHTNNGMFELRSDTNEIEELLNILKGVDKK